MGAVHDNLTVGQVLSDPARFITRLGDINQEDITNDSVQVWSQMACYRFELTDTPNLNHFELPGDPAVLNRLLHNLQRTKSVCP